MTFVERQRAYKANIIPTDQKVGGSNPSGRARNGKPQTIDNSVVCGFFVFILQMEITNSYLICNNYYVCSNCCGYGYSSRSCYSNSRKTRLETSNKA